HVRVYPPVSLRLPSAVFPALLKRQLTISRTSAEFMQAYRKDTIHVRSVFRHVCVSPTPNRLIDKSPHHRSDSKMYAELSKVG
ncbi:MAG: hypothetical protein ACREYE_13075, partial [Gammaproteobacteria bacterium]